ncbi:MAG TPA: hypothetical protein VGF44_18345 [Terriglobales bacterium]|jgi:hypothetical protein
MAKVFTFRNLGLATRVAADQVKRSQGANALWRGVLAWARHIGHVLHQLWLEVTGFIFFAVAAIGAVGIIREYVQYTAGKSSYARLGLAIGFTLLFTWFGLSSFWRLRRKLAKLAAAK